jgi:glycine/D-amino acid oxidase-like deaminating enzyme
MSTQQLALPVAVIGGGPVGLAAAAHLVTRGVPVKLYEADETVAANVRDWGHVRLFSPWGFNTDTASTAILREHGWQSPPATTLPSGHDLYAAYLQPLAETWALRGVIETGARVRNVSRHGIDKVVSRGRTDHPFALTIDEANGRARVDLARAVIDASGTWSHQNPAAASGTPAIGEVAFADRIAYGVPDVLGRHRGDYAGRRVLVVGGGHSAANVLLDLARLAEADPHLQIVWAVRAASLARLFGGGVADKLPARGKLGDDLRHLVDSGRLKLTLSFGVERIDRRNDGLTVLERGTDPRVLGPVDRIVVCTGQRPDLSLTRELRLDLDPWLESARALGPLIDPNLHSCGSVPPHGYQQLAHPEPGYFAVGVKSYGRAPTFLMATGYEQVRSVAAHLAGDEAAARDVRLVLPETGVCSTNLAPSIAASEGCCDGPAKSDACCVADATAKASGETGCGCGPTEAVPVAAQSCSGSTRNG